jgi:thymidylate synthase
MHVIHARNVHQALPLALEALQQIGRQRDSRNGPVLVSDHPVTTVYEKPCERVIFWEARDANPYFHFFESLWMLAGRNDVAYPTKFVKRMKDFSDDGKTFHGAYGYRWRKQWFDQLPPVIKALKKNPDDRRQVVQIWDAGLDLTNQEGAKDKPCNLTVNFQIVQGKLNMSVFNRSNDIVWGCYGANAVHFSFLQEFMASCIGVPVGFYYQISCNWHGYLSTVEPLMHLADHAPDPYRTTKHCPYENKMVEPFPLMSVEQKVWEEDLAMFLGEEIEFGYRDAFFRRVAKPLLHSHMAYKDGDLKAAKEILGQCMATDWARACHEWLGRRKGAKNGNS